MRLKVALLLLGAAVSPAATAAQPTVQQLFETAAAAMARADYQAAATGFEEIGQRLPPTSTRSRAIAEARAGYALMRLGRRAEAEQALRHALPLLPASDASLADDRWAAAADLALLEEQDSDYPAARRDYAIAIANAVEPLDRANGHLGLARTTMFLDADAALGLADAAQAELAGVKSITKAQLAAVRTLRGRILLNAGRFQAASKELLAAVAQLGGLTAKVTSEDIAARSDLAIAALLEGDAGKAKQYLAYSGSGNLLSGFAQAADMEPPPCGEEGLDPHDVGVVEFGLADDGGTIMPHLIYSSARGDKVLLFARAVADWSWTTAQAAEVRPFFRKLLRVELRCSTALRNESVDLLGAEPAQWGQNHGAQPSRVDASSAAAAVPLLRAELARREAEGGDAVKLLPTLLALSNNAVTTPEEARGWMERAARIAHDDRAPPVVQAVLRLRAMQSGWAATTAGRSESLAALRTLLDDPAIAGDARSAAMVRLTLVQQLVEAKARAAALPYLRQIVADDRLDAKDLLRVAALTRIATIEAANGHIDVARDAYLKTGLTAGQCALVDVKPLRTHGSIGSSDYPIDAFQWNIGGWAVTEFDVRADGMPANVRTLVAYPPFVFGAPTEQFINRSHYTQSFRPDGQLGCGANRQLVRFVAPSQSTR